jgi:hypothetical protein
VEQRPFVGLVLWATDVPALARFLSQVAGLEAVEEYPGYAKLHAWNAVVELHGDDAADRRHPWYRALAKEGVARGIGAELRIRVEAVDQAYARALEIGALGLQAPATVDGAHQATVMGPDGYCFTLWE